MHGACTFLAPYQEKRVYSTLSEQGGINRALPRSAVRGMLLSFGLETNLFAKKVCIS